MKINPILLVAATLGTVLGLPFVAVNPPNTELLTANDSELFGLRPYMLIAWWRRNDLIGQLPLALNQYIMLNISQHEEDFIDSHYRRVASIVKRTLVGTRICMGTTRATHKLIECLMTVAHSIATDSHVSPNDLIRITEEVISEEFIDHYMI